MTFANVTGVFLFSKGKELVDLLTSLKVDKDTIEELSYIDVMSVYPTTKGTYILVDSSIPQTLTTEGFLAVKVDVYIEYENAYIVL